MASSSSRSNRPLTSPGGRQINYSRILRESVHNKAGGTAAPTADLKCSTFSNNLNMSKDPPAELYSFRPQRTSLPSIFVSDDTSSVNNTSAIDFPFAVNHQNKIGNWRCCKCCKSYDVYERELGVHPISKLYCDCGHKSCFSCKLDGSTKQFEPLSDPEVVPVYEIGRNKIRYGVICHGCGTSWRAQPFDEVLAKKSTLHRLYTLPKRWIKGHTQPHSMKHSQSMADLLRPRSSHKSQLTSRSTVNLRLLSEEPEKVHEKQAGLAIVKFKGLICSCGIVTDQTSLCFQAVDPLDEMRKLMEGRKTAGFGTRPEDQARGHQTPAITLMHRIHPNPLLSSPVPKEDFSI